MRNGREHAQQPQGHRAGPRTRRILFGGGALAIAGAATVAVSLASAGGNTGNSTVTGYRMDEHGTLSLTDEVGIATPPSAKSQGVIDLAVTQDEKFVYVQNAVSGTVDGFRVEADGALTKVTTAEGLPAFDESGMEGIAAV
ncbi:beta-propeller fold lactonase family protein [Streptomyces swartbergensis]|uniref:beta-propeller fold lactonase family protein n=1 Tax=Streptomyces swartbergensis TaxID=487165 RepID=UPI001FCA1969|nr:beta-propeller fold lactonase family protein [Streptomyces swartbergensis]